MKKDLPNHSLRDQLDALPYEFEEAHWDNLGSRLHANGGETAQKEQAAFNWSRLGLLLLLGLLIGGVVYWGKIDQNPVENISIESGLTSPTANNLKVPEATVLEGVEEAETNKEEIDGDKRIERPAEAKIKTAPIDDVRSNEEELIKKGADVVEKSSPKMQIPIDEEEKLIDSNHLIEKSEVQELVNKKEAATVEPRTIMKQEELPLLATAPQPIRLADFSYPSKIAKWKLITKKERKNRWGIISGFNFSNGQPGLFLGLSYQRALKSPWYLEAGISYRGSNVKRWNIDPSNLNNFGPGTGGWDDVEVHYLNRLRYVDFPLLVKWKPIKQLSFQAGPKLAVLTLASGRVTRTSIIDASVNPPETQTRTTNNSTFLVTRINSLRTIEWGAVMGATWHLDKHIGIGLRSHFGLTPFSDTNIIGPSPQKRNLDIQFLVQLYL